LAKQFSGEDFLKWANQKQELPVAVMFVNESGRNEQPSIDASYQPILKNLLLKTAWPNKSNFGRKDVWKVLCKDYSFLLDPLINMAATGDSCFLHQKN
jgi:hypothetical protein